MKRFNKKALITMMVAVSLIFCVILANVVVRAATQKVHKDGLEATWYQADEYVANPVGLGELLNQLGAFDVSFDRLLRGDDPVFTKVGTNILSTFEIAGWLGNPDFAEIDEGLNLFEEAYDMGLIVSEDGSGNVFSLVIEYNGFITAKETGEYQFLSKYCDNNLILEIGGKRVFESWGGFNFTPPNPQDSDYIIGETVRLEAGVPVKFQAFYLKQGGGNVVRMDVRKDGGDIQFFSDIGFRLSHEVEESVAPTEEPTPPATPEMTSEPTTEATQTPEPTLAATTTPTTPTTSQEESEQGSSVTGIIIGIMVAVVVLGGGAGAYYYFKVIKGNKD